MRLWSIHPSLLDSKGMVALWREGLLAQKVLSGKTKGYKHHPQLQRFRNSSKPLESIAAYLSFVFKEALKRGYNFDKSKIMKNNFEEKIEVTNEQLKYEFKHLLNKLKIRDRTLYAKLKNLKEIESHPLFNVIEGGIESWEIVE